MYFGGGGEHAYGDIVVDLDGGLGHNVSKGLYVLVKVLQLLADHCTKDAFDLALLGEVGKGRELCYSFLDHSYSPTAANPLL